MANSFDLMLGEFKEVAELKVFAESQFKTITELNRKLKALEEEKEHLKKLLEQSTPLLIEDKKNFLGFDLDISNEEIICLRQLAMLKEISMERQLTLEETRQCEIFSKILLNLKSAPKTIKVDSKNLSEKELLALVEIKDNEHRT